MSSGIKDFVDAVKTENEEPTKVYEAIVSGVDDEGIVWVNIAGSEKETPTASTSTEVKTGDIVNVEWRNNKLYIAGNYSNPAVGIVRVVQVEKTATSAEETATEAKETADAVEGIAVNASATAVTAKTIAEGVNEHFWHDNTGAHVTEVTQEEWNDPADPNYHSGGNTLITTQGMAIRKGLVNLAEFGATGATIGVSGSQIAHLGYGPGTDSGGGISDAPYYTLGVRTGTVGNYSTAEGNGTEASSFASHAEGGETTASGGCSHAEGYDTTASGADSHAEGYNTTASGNWSHTEGQLTVASDEGAHAEGLRATASGENSHAEGSVTTASGFDAHAQNGGTVASGDYSHAGGDSTIAGYDSQTTIGRYNDNQSTTAFEIGNGTADNARSNAFTVDWSGNVKIAGDITGFYKIVQLAVTTSSSISAHGSYANATYTVPSADRPSGMTLAGIVGWGASNYRLSPSTAFVNGTHSISVTLANTSASSVSSGATVNFRLLYIKATSA